MSTLYIRLPSKAVSDYSPNWLALACPFALVSHGSSIERQGSASLSELSETIAKSHNVVLLLAASDVTLLRVKVPPLSQNRLKSALPNLVEDRLIDDSSDCLVVAGGLSEGLRTVAVVQRAWLDRLARTLVDFGARHIAALPAQLCLPYQSTWQSDQPAGVVAAIDERSDGDQNADIEMTLRLSEQDGIGLAITHEQDEPAASVAILTLCAVVSEAPVTLYVPQSLVNAYQEVVNDTISLNKRISVFADNWSRWIAGANVTTLDLMAGLGLRIGAKLDWRPLRWPLALAAAVLLINAAALNIDWWRLKNETNALRAVMIQIYKSAYPNETVIIDPITQMKQKILAAKHSSGMAAPNDFTAIVAAFGEAWSGAVASTDRSTAIASLEYHDHNLFVHLKPGGETPTKQIQAALAKRDLALELAPEQTGAVVWKIGNAK